MLIENELILLANNDRDVIMKFNSDNFKLVVRNSGNDLLPPFIFMHF